MLPCWQRSWITYVGNRIVDRLDHTPKAWLLWTRGTWKLCGNVYEVGPDDPIVYLVPQHSAGVSGPVYRQEDTLAYLARNGKLEEAFAALNAPETIQ